MYCFKQKPAYELLLSDWSSDVCSSDLRVHPGIDRLVQHGVRRCAAAPGLPAAEAAGAGGTFADAAPRQLMPLHLDRGPRLRRGRLRLPLAPARHVILAARCRLGPGGIAALRAVGRRSGLSSLPSGGAAFRPAEGAI